MSDKSGIMIFFQRRSLRLAAFISMLVLHAGRATAEDITQSDLELCAGLETAELKLACFEALTAMGGQREAGSVENPENDDVMHAPVPPAPAAVAPEDSSTAELPRPESKTAGAEKTDGLPPASRPAPIVTARTTDTGEDLGSEQLARSAGENRTVSMTVIEVSEGRHGILYFHMADGQVWRQIEGRRYRYPKNTAFDVIVSTGMMGDYRLRVEADGPMTRIRRVK